MTQDFGLRALIPHIYEVIGIEKKPDDMREVRYETQVARPL